MPQNNGYGQSPQQGIFPKPQNFSSASMPTNSQYQIQSNNQSGNLVSATLQSNLNPNANTFVPNYQNQINIPPVTQVQSPSVEQQNPFTRSANSTPTVSNNGYYNQLQNQISPTPPQNNSNNHQNQFTAQTTNMQFTPLSDSQKYKLNNFHARLREFDNDQDHIRKCRKSDYPEFPQNPDLNYMDWRAAYLMQAQIHNMHLLYDPNHVPAHIMFPLPLPDDPLYEGREELYQAAKDIHNAMVRNHTLKITLQANTLVHVLRNNPTAKKFIRPNAVNPAQIFRDLDSMWIQQNMMTKGEFVTRFFKMKPDRDERFASFMARVDSLQHELRSMFSYEVKPDDIMAVMQQGITNDMQPTFHHMLQEGKSIIDIRKAMIAIEVTKLRHLASANSVRDFVDVRADRQHRSDSPHNQHWKYKNNDSRHNSPGRSSFRYNNNNRNDKHFSSFRRAGSPHRGQSPSFRRSGDGQNRSRSRSPYADDRRSPGRHNPRSAMKTGHGGRSRTPERDDRKRSFRSPSPGGSHRHETRKTVNFKYPSAQTAEAESPSVAAQATQDDNDATDPDLRVTDSNTNTHDDGTTVKSWDQQTLRWGTIQQGQTQLYHSKMSVHGDALIQLIASGCRILT